MKPLLILPPAPLRWMATEELLAHEPAARLNDLKVRIAEGVDGAADALAAIPDGSRFHSVACIRRRREIGVVGQMFTQEHQRKKGLARALLQTLLGWFDMTGGKWLYATAPAELVDDFFAHFGFRVLHRGASDGQACVTLLRRLSSAAESPYDAASAEVEIRDVSRGDWPLIVSLHQHLRGADPRSDAAESALLAERTAADLLAQQDDGVCHLRGAFCSSRLVGLASIATERLGDRTYAMLIPHDRPPERLREAVVEFAKSKGYERIDYPMEALAEPAAAESPPSEANSSNPAAGDADAQRGT